LRLNKFWLPVYLYAFLIFILSSIPKLPQISPDIPNLDKLLHIIEYGIFGLLLARAFENSSAQFLRPFPYVEGGRSILFRIRDKTLILTIIISCLYGITDEIHQAFVPGRESNAWDVLFDTIGALLFVWIKRKRL